uniref:Secretion system C-terminal sorting domain-containing protein n=1 Tax=uncultured bacterium BLR12 TaxID=506514 RepID=C0INE3_9BACT|nr:hypothetical protein AKSOIL_0214 [uncultured bacterium BLR12]
MGEYAVETVSSTDRMYTQGFHQPYLIVISSFAFTANKSIYNIAIAPNPVLSTLNFSISSSRNTQVLVSLADIHGKLLLHQKVNSSFGNIQFNFKGLPAGSYNLTVREVGSSRVIKSCQVIKL